MDVTRNGRNSDTSLDHNVRFYRYFTGLTTYGNCGREGTRSQDPVTTTGCCRDEYREFLGRLDSEVTFHVIGLSETRRSVSFCNYFTNNIVSKYESLSFYFILCRRHQTRMSLKSFLFR